MGATGRSNRAPPHAPSRATAPASARKERDAWPATSKLHHSVWEYSTSRCASRVSNPVAISTPTTLAIHPGVNDWDSQRAPPVEVAAARSQRQEHPRQQRGLLPIETLQERDDRPGSEQRERQRIGGVDTLLDRPREQQQRHADDAAEHVGHLEHRQGQQALEELEAAACGRRGARGEQDDPAGERRQRKGSRDDRRSDLLQDAPATAQGGAPQQQLMGQQERDSQDEWRHVVDEPIADQRAEHLIAREPRAQQHHHRGLEDADTARHVADEPEELRQENGPEHAAKAEPIGRREQHPHCGGRDDPVDGRNQELRRRVARPGKLEREPAHGDRARATGRDGHVDGRHGQQDHTEQDGSPRARDGSRRAPRAATGRAPCPRRRGTPART